MRFGTIRVNANVFLTSHRPGFGFVSFSLFRAIDNCREYRQGTPCNYHLTEQWRWWESKATVPRFKLREEPKVKTVLRTVFRESVDQTYDRRCRSEGGAAVTDK